MRDLKQNFTLMMPLSKPMALIITAVEATPAADRKDVYGALLAAFFMDAAERFGPMESLDMIANAIRTVPRAAAMTHEFAQVWDEGAKH